MSKRIAKALETLETEMLATDGDISSVKHEADGTKREALIAGIDKRSAKVKNHFSKVLSIMGIGASDISDRVGAFFERVAEIGAFSINPETQQRMRTYVEEARTAFNTVCNEDRLRIYPGDLEEPEPPKRNRGTPKKTASRTRKKLK